MNAPGSDIPPRGASRIELRPLREADEAMYCGLYTDPETMAFIGPPLSREDVVRSFRTTLCKAEAGSPFIGVLVDASGEVLGVGGWQAPNLHRCEVEIGLVLQKSARQRKLSSAALAVVIDHAFARLPVDLVWVQYARTHIAVDRMCARLGMEPGQPERPTTVTRSVHRSMWPWGQTANQRGADHVEYRDIP